MKKKKLSLEKKLSLKKEGVAVLNGAQQRALAGGVIITRTLACEVTRDATCETFRYTEDMCILC